METQGFSKSNPLKKWKSTLEIIRFHFIKALYFRKASQNAEMNSTGYFLPCLYKTTFYLFYVQTESSNDLSYNLEELLVSCSNDFIYPMTPLV